MRIKGNASFLILLLTLCLIADVDAGWKFWKKKDKDATTTAAPEVSTTEAARVTPISGVSSTVARAAVSTTTARPPGFPNNAGSAIIGAGNPGLAIGVGATGQDIRNNARPQRPNPGTEVGLDGGQPRPSRPGVGGNNGQGYREWAAEFTGAGEPGRQQPNSPSAGATLNRPDSRQPSSPGSPSQPQPSAPATAGPRTTPSPASTPASRASPVPANIPSQHQPQPQPQPQPRPQPQPQYPGSRPSSVPGSPTGSVSNPDFPPLGPRTGGNQVPNQGTGGNQVSTLVVGTLKPAGSTTPSPTRVGSPTQPGRSWADIAGSGSTPNSPTASPRQPNYPRQPSPGQSRPSAGAIAAGGAGVAGIAAGAAAAGAATGTASTGATGGKVYSSNPTYSKGNTITDEDLEKLAEALFIKDTNNANSHITLNLQKTTTSSSPTDEAPQALFTVHPNAYEITTIQRVQALFDNYQLDTHTNEYISPAQRQEESLLVDTFLSTNVMSAAMRFLADKGHVRKDYYEYKDTLRKLWFNLFSRGQGKIGSTGFEHVFMAELKPGTPNPEVLGLHNWIYFSKEESKRTVDYLGYIKKVDLGNKASIIKLHAKFNGHDKPVTTMFVGTSPELEMALYTVCFYARPDASCPVSLGGTKFNIVTYKFKYRGNDLVGTAYPDI